MLARFGTAGTPEDFKEKGFKGSAEIPDYLEQMGLNAFEYQCGQGVRIGNELAAKLGEKAKEKDIRLSLHAPYYISLSSVEEEKRNKSVEYILQSARAAKAMGAERIVIHSGSCGKLPRETALQLAGETLLKARKALIEEGLEGIRCCPETMGKINQLGTLTEVLHLCSLDESFLPCIDFGHLNARTAGGCCTMEDYREVLDEIENTLGTARLNEFHSHFSKIEYTQKGGEVRHLTFEDQLFGPEFEPLMELIAKKGLSPVFICESAGTQGIDAAAMKIAYEKY